MPDTALLKIDLAQSRWMDFLAQRPKPINTTQNKKRKNRYQRKKKCSNSAKNMMIKKDDPINTYSRSNQIMENGSQRNMQRHHSNKILKVD
jgi:hypothetical protein